MFLQLSRVSYSRCFRCEPRIRLSQQSLSRTLQRPSILETFHLSISATIRPTISRPNFLAIFIIARRLYLYFFVLPFRSHARLRLHFSIVFRSERRFIEGNFYLLCYLVIRRTISKLNDIEGTIGGLRAARSREQ